MKNRRNGIESFLFWLLICQATVMAILISVGNIKVEFYGQNYLAFLVLTTGMAAYAYIIWRLRAPTIKLLIIGAVFFGIHVFQIKWATGMWSSNVGVTVMAQLFKIGEVNIKMNIGNFIIFILFLKALEKRKSSEASINSEKPESA